MRRTCGISEYIFPLFAPLAAVLICAAVALAQSTVVQDATLPESALTVETRLGASPAKVELLQRSPELLIVFPKDVTPAADYDASRKFIAAVYKAAQSSIDIRLGVLAGNALDIAGPFGNTAELQAALRNLKPDPDAPAASDAATFFTGLANALDTTAAAGGVQWGYTVVLGRMPMFAAPVQQYASAWLMRRFRRQRRSVLFRDFSGDARAGWLDRVTRGTGGVPSASTEELIGFLFNPGIVMQISWQPIRLSRGFELETVGIKGLRAPLAVASIETADAALPSIAEYAESREKVSAVEAGIILPAADLPGLKAAIDEVLKVNPADAQAVRLGITLASRMNDEADEIALLETAIELTPSDVSVWTRSGDLNFRQKNFTAAEKALLRAKELGTPSARLYEELGRIRLARQDSAHALEYLLESVRLDDTQQDLWFLAADLSKELGQSEGRIQALEKGLGPGGNYLARRTELIRLYFEKGDKAGAARHADLELPRLPRDAITQTIWAQFYQRLERHDDALGCWKRVIEADGKNELAHFAVSAAMLNKHAYGEALDAAERGLGIAPGSARIVLIKVRSLEKLDRIYEARHALSALDPATKDLALRRYAAEMADAHGGDAPGAYQKYAEALLETPPAPGDEVERKAELKRVLERGTRVSIRDGNAKVREWFEDELPWRLNPGSIRVPRAAGVKPEVTTILGGLNALSWVAGGQPDISPERYLVSFCRRVISYSMNPKTLADFQKGLTTYFKDIRQLINMSTRTAAGAELTLSVANKQAQNQTENVLELLGWRMHRVKGEIVVDYGQKKEQNQRQEIAAALNLDQGAMQAAFRAGKPFGISIPIQTVPVLFSEATWRNTLQTDKFSGGLVEALGQTPEQAKYYVGLSNADDATRRVLLSSIPYGQKNAELLASYSSALAVSGSKVAVPGGAAAEAEWASMVGANPADPASFFRRLFDKDDGRMLAWFFVVSELDWAHQKFFTLSLQRNKAFYEAFTQSDDMQVGAGKIVQNSTFGDFLRAIPLVDNTVDFPGSGEVWMVSNGRTISPGDSARLMKRVRKKVAPDVEDAILLRLAKTRSKIGFESVSETDAFLAAVAIDRAQVDGLAEESALLLGQNYQEFRSYYPYFLEFRSLTNADFHSFFAFPGKVRQAKDADTETALGQFNAVLEILRLSIRFGRLEEPRVTSILRTFCAAFGRAADSSGYTAAVFDAVRELIATAAPLPDQGGGSPDELLAALVLGRTEPLAWEHDGKTLELDSTPDRLLAYGRVLDLQKAPAVAPLLQIEKTVRQIAAGKETYGPLIALLAKTAPEIPGLEIQKAMKLPGWAKQSVERYSPARLLPLITELQAKTGKKKVNPKDVEKICGELMEVLGSEIRLALTGKIYAANLGPDNLMVENDPLLLRKHQAFDHPFGTAKRPQFPTSELIKSTSGEGSYFIGVFADFATAAIRSGEAENGGAHGVLYITQLAAIRNAPWHKYRDADQRLLGLQMRVAREWCVYAADDAQLLSSLAEETLGILALNRRRALLTALSARQWDAVWDNVTLSDLVLIGERYLRRYSKAPFSSLSDEALRAARKLTAGYDLAYLRGSPAPLAPYEEFEHHLFPGEMAERAAEMSIYLCAALDTGAMPAGIAPFIAEPLAKRLFAGMHMSDERDWAGALAAFARIDEKAIQAALADKK